VDEPPGTDHGAHGEFDRQAHARSPQLWLSQHVRPALLAGAGLGLAGLAVIRGRTR
jgi:hypothetical protein